MYAAAHPHTAIHPPTHLPTQVLDEVLPKDAHLKLNARRGRVTIGVTELGWSGWKPNFFLRPKAITSFSSREDLIEVLLASCNVPVLFAGPYSTHPPFFLLLPPTHPPTQNNRQSVSHLQGSACCRRVLQRTHPPLWVSLSPFPKDCVGFSFSCVGRDAWSGPERGGEGGD